MTVTMNPSIRTIAAALGLAAALAAGAARAQSAAPVTAEGAWARASVPGQKASGAFMKLTAKSATRLVGVASPVAGVAEVHEMKMDGEVMKMRAIDGLDLPAGKPVELKPGGYHLMLQDLKAPLQKDSTVALTLFFKDAAGKASQLEMKVPVALVAPAGAAAPMAMDGMKGMKDMEGHKH